MAALLLRILQVDVPPVGRPDVPPSLDAALRSGLARDPAVRTPTALAFAQALQQAQRELGLEVTEPVVFDVAKGGEGPAPAAPSWSPPSPGAVTGGPGGAAGPTGAPAGVGWGDGMVPDLRPAFGTAAVAGDATVDRARLPGAGRHPNGDVPPPAAPGPAALPFSAPPPVPAAPGPDWPPAPAPPPRPRTGRRPRPPAQPGRGRPRPRHRRADRVGRRRRRRRGGHRPPGAGAGRPPGAARQPRPAAVDVEGGARRGGRARGGRRGRRRGDGPARPLAGRPRAARRRDHHHDRAGRRPDRRAGRGEPGGGAGRLGR